MMQGGYQQPGTTVVVVQQPTPWGRPNRYRYGEMRHGMTLSGIVLSLPVIIILGLLGGFLVLSGILSLALGSFSPTGIMPLIFGGLMIAACISLAHYAKKKNQNNWTSSTDNPGRVINRNPSPSPMHQPLNAAQPYGNSPAGTQMPAGMPPAGGYGPVAMGSYPPSPVGQPLGFPPPAAAPAGTGSPYPSSPVGQTGYPPPSAMEYSSSGLQVPPSTLPGMTVNPGNPVNPTHSEYSAPPPYAPDYKSPY